MKIQILNKFFESYQETLANGNVLESNYGSILTLVYEENEKSIFIHTFLFILEISAEKVGLLFDW